VTEPQRRAQTVSAVIVCRNEEAVIGRCLESLDGVVDEIVLVHDGDCDDRTLEIAREFGCRVFVRPLYGACEHHQPFAFETAQSEWLLVLDADEFLSPELRRDLGTLLSREDVDCWELLWPIWSGARYTSESGNYKRVLVRRDRARMAGVVHWGLRVAGGRVARSEHRLEHKPLYNNYSWRTVLTKWRRWARLNAECFLTDWDELPTYGYPASEQGWPRWRRWTNALSPFLFVPYGFAFGALTFVRHRDVGLGRALRLSVRTAFYAAMVQAYVAKLKYLDGYRRK
jgi:glycosyltransferase involved in cell wall biosynthesis